MRNSAPSSSDEALLADLDDSVARERYRTLIDSMSDGVFRLNSGFHITAVNDTVLAVTGYSRDELLGEHVSVLLEPAAVKRLERETAQRRESSDGPVERSIQTAHGETVACLLQVSPLSPNVASQGSLGIVHFNERPSPTPPKSASIPTDLLVSLIGESESAALVLNDAFEIVWADPTIGQYFGIDVDDIVGCAERQVVNDRLKDAVSNAERFETRLDATHDSSSVESFELLVTAGEGRKQRWLEHRSRPITAGRYAGGRIECYTDISERKRSADALKIATEEFQSLVDSVTEYAIFSLNRAGTVTSWNDGATAIMGYAAADIVGEHVSTFYTAADRAEGLPEKNLETAAEAGSVEDEGWRRRKDGSRIWATVTITAVRDTTGTHRGYLQVTRDVTDEYTHRKELEDELANLLDRVSDGFFGLDDEWRFTYLNDRAAELVGVSLDEAHGERIWELFPDAVGSPVEEHFQRAMGEQVPVSFEEFFPPLGLWLAVSAYPSETGLSVYFRNVTERRTRQQQLEASNERLEQFAYAASHDLQEPLRMVSSYLRLIEERYEDALDEDGREFLAFAVDGADRMRDMIEGLLAYSRIESAGDPFEPVELDSVVEDVTDSLQLVCNEQQAEITTGELPRVSADRGQLRQLFQNLLENAMENSGDAPPRIHISAERNGKRWVVSVSDEGVGIDPADADRIFEVFESLDGPDEKDSGIGLALCKRIVERHGGEIRVDSSLGEGATFSVTLPAVGDTDE